MIIVKRTDQLSDLEKMSLIDLSYSRMDSYLSCAAKYFFSYIKKEPRMFGQAAALR